MGGFSSSLGSLAVTIGAKIDGFEKSMGTVSQRLNAVDREASRAFSGFEKLGDRLTTVGTGLTAAITLPLAGAAIAATKFATDFELGMRQVTSLLGGVTAQEFSTLSKSVLQLSRDMGIDAVKATNALYEAISAGVPKENAIEFIEVSSKAAIAGLTDTAVAVDALTTIIAAYSLEFSDAQKVSDAMFQAVNVGKFTFGELAAVIGPAAAQAKNLGVSYEELLAATSTLSITSGGVGQAVTQIESAFRSLLSPTKEMSAALKQIGFESGSAAVQSLEFGGTLEALRQTTGGSAEAFNKLFGRIEGASGALGLTGDRAVAAAKDLEIMRSATGALDVAFRQIDQTTSRQFERLTAELKTTAIELGMALLPAVNGLLNAAKPLISVLADVVRWFTMLPEPIQSTLIGVAALAAAVGPLVIVAGQAVTAFAALAPALTSAYGSLTTLAAGSGTAAAAVTALQGAAVLTAGAFLGWKLGSWAYDQIPGFRELGDAMAGVLLAAPGVEALINRMVGATAAAKDQEFATSKLEEALRRQGVTVIKEGKTQEEYEKLLRETAKQISAMNDRMKEGATSAGKFGSATGKAGGQVDKFREAVEAEKKSIKDAAERAKIHERAMRELGLETKKTTTALDDLTQKVETYNKTVSNARDFKLFDAAIKSAAAASQSTRVFTEELDILGIAAGMADQKLEHLGDSTLPILTIGTDASILKQRELTEAFKTLGITSAASLQGTADKNREAYEAISADAGSSLKDVIAAWVKYQESAIEAAKAAGQQIPAEQQASLDRMKEQLGVSTKDQAGIWDSFGRSVSTVITNFAQDISRSLWEGDLSWGEKGKELLKSLGTAVTSLFIEPATAALTKFITGVLSDLIGGKGFGGVTQAAKDLGSTIAGVFGGGGGQAAGTVAGGVGGGAGTVGGVAGQAAGMGVSAVAGIVTGAVSAVSGVVGNVQMAGMNKSLDLIERYTRRTEIMTEEILNKGVNLFLAELPGIREIVGAFQDHHAWRIHDVWDRLGEIKDVLWIDTNGILTEIRDSIQAPRISAPIAAASGATGMTVNIQWNANDPTGFRGLLDNARRSL